LEYITGKETQVAMPKNETTSRHFSPLRHFKNQKKTAQVRQEAKKKGYE
jgi:hypothetical protein